MVTPRTGRPRGRPRRPWREDPDRYLVALLQALLRAPGRAPGEKPPSEREVALTLTTLIEGFEGDLKELKEALEDGGPLTPMWAAWGRDPENKSAEEPTIAARIRTKLPHADDLGGQRWLGWMTAAFWNSLFGPDDLPKIHALCLAAGEEDFLLNRLLPIFEYRHRRAPPTRFRLADLMG